jgi:branched-chain amino acid transport system substrate-binding protein
MKVHTKVLGAGNSRQRAVHRRWLMLAITALGATALLASTSMVAAASTPHSVKSQAATTPGWPVTNYVKYVGGKAGSANSKLSPVYIGWVNQQGGEADLAPEATTGAQFSVKFVNQRLGGIDGHPLILETCFIPDTVSAAQQCGDQFANDSRIKLVVVGSTLSVGNQAFENALRPTRKLLIFFSGTPVDSSYKQAIWLYGSGTSLEGPLATFAAQDLHAKSVALVWDEIPGESVIIGQIVAALKLEHVKYTSVGFDPSTTDLTVPLEAADASKASVILAGVNGPPCVNFNTALKQLGINKPVIANVTCISGSIITGDGGVLPRWYYAVGSSLDSDTSDPSGAAFNRIAKEYGISSLASDNWITVTFSQILTAVKFMNEVGPTHLQPAALYAVAKDFHGPMLWGPPTLTCGDFTSAPQVCLDEDQFFQPNAKGVFIRVQSWIGPPKGASI